MASNNTTKVRKLLKNGYSIKDVVGKLRISRSMVYRIRAEMVAAGDLPKPEYKTPKPVEAPIRTLQGVPPEPAKTPYGLGSFHTNKPPIVTQKVQPKTLWQRLKEIFV